MPLICLCCGARVSDDHADPCPGNGKECGAREWVWVDAPKGELTLTLNDRRYLKSIRIAQD